MDTSCLSTYTMPLQPLCLTSHPALSIGIYSNSRRGMACRLLRRMRCFQTQKSAEYMTRSAFQTLNHNKTFSYRTKPTSCLLMRVAHRHAA